MIAIVNYGSGNLQAICNIYNRLRIPYAVASTPQELGQAERALLPGVGAFDQAMGELDRSGLRAALDDFAAEGRPVLGICVGMQLLARTSEEGSREGLGWIDGTVRRFPAAVAGRRLQLPHMGWNTATLTRPDPLFAGVDLRTGFYFLHSYYFSCGRAEDELARTDYGGGYVSAVRRRNVFGVQFHPEKSHQAGVAVLRNFATSDLAH